MNDDYCFYCSSDSECMLGYTDCMESTDRKGGEYENSFDYRHAAVLEYDISGNHHMG